MSTSVARLLFKTAPYPQYFALQIRSKICDQTERYKEKDEVKKTNCFDQVKALHDRDTHPVSHVIMDLDGVILDSARYNAIAHEEYLMKWKKHLKTVTKYKILGLRNVDAGNIITYEYDMPFDGNVYAHGVWQIQRTLYHQSKIVRGIDDVVCYFLQHKMPVALISSVHTKAFKILHSKLHGFEKNFCHIVHADEVVEGKPKPEILIKAARLFHDGPRSLNKYLVIDSSYQGALAAKAAGMQVILCTDEHMPKDMQAAANVVLHHMDDFDPTEFHLPAKKK
ncbi:unnamed protein product [Nezara viridula]|uniref:Uncharacterized protein n=1 Tax=Nezara viridula TaxID=85310 RepID=A0A9P0MU21_NEZVI|nr:unnamed protein product [Nezara viridula]